MNLSSEPDALGATGATAADYRRWLDALDVGVVIQGADGAVLASNEAASRILDLTSAEISGRTSTDPRWRAVRADGRAFPGEDHPSMVTIQTGEAVRNVVMGLQSETGSTRWIQINSHPISDPETGRVLAAATTFRDITEERNEQEAAGLRYQLERVAFSSVRSLLGLSGAELDAGLSEALQAVAQVLGADRAYIIRSSHPGEDLVCTQEWCAPGVPAFHRARSPLPWDRYVRLVEWSSEFDIVDLPFDEGL
ncbi:MAG: PAS domain S-box protein, partial [Acidimicrobiia bacterium]